jgi:hypothetical protein
MKLIGRFFDWILGNGKLDLDKHETEVRRRKEGAKGCMDETQSNFKLMQRAFEDVGAEEPREISVPEEPPCLREDDRP